MRNEEIAETVRRFGRKAREKHRDSQKKAMGAWKTLKGVLRDEELLELGVAWDHVKLEGACELDEKVRAIAARYSASVA